MKQVHEPVVATDEELKELEDVHGKSRLIKEPVRVVNYDKQATRANPTYGHKDTQGDVEVDRFLAYPPKEEYDTKISLEFNMRLMVTLLVVLVGGGYVMSILWR